MPGSPTLLVSTLVSNFRKWFATLEYSFIVFLGVLSAALSLIVYIWWTTTTPNVLLFSSAIFAVTVSLIAVSSFKLFDKLMDCHALKATCWKEQGKLNQKLFNIQYFPEAPPKKPTIFFSPHIQNLFFDPPPDIDPAVNSAINEWRKGNMEKSDIVKQYLKTHDISDKWIDLVDNGPS